MSATTYTKTTRVIQWMPCSHVLPPQGRVVETKIDDVHGVRNECRLQYFGPLWFHPDGLTYVYWQPTHWRDL